MTMKIHGSFNQRHELLCFTVEGKKRTAFCKRKMEEVPRFAFLEGKIDDIIDEQERRKTTAKADSDVSILNTFLQRKVELRNVAQLDELFNELVLTVRTKDGNEYEKDFIQTVFYEPPYFGLPFLEEIFALVNFKTEVVPFSLKVFILHNCKHLQFAMAFIN